MFLSFHAQIAEDLGGLSCFVLGIEREPQLVGRVRLSPNQHELCAWLVEKIRWINRHEAAVPEPLHQTLRHLRSLGLAEADTRR